MKPIHLPSFITDHGSFGSYGFLCPALIAEIAETTICLILSVASVQSVFVFTLNAHQRS